MSKSVAFNVRPAKKAAPINQDAWVAGGKEDAPAPKLVAVPAAEEMKRFTIDVPVSLHTRVKAECAMCGLKMADVPREMLEREFPCKSNL